MGLKNFRILENKGATLHELQEIVRHRHYMLIFVSANSPQILTYFLLTANMKLQRRLNSCLLSPIFPLDSLTHLLKLPIDTGIAVQCSQSHLYPRMDNPPAPGTLLQPRPSLSLLQFLDVFPVLENSI